MALPLVVTSVAIPAEQTDRLVELLPADQALSWIRDGEGLIGGGVAARLDCAGQGRFDDASAWWEKLASAAHVTDEVGLAGSGLICFGSFGFAAEPGDSVLIVPRWVVGRRGDTAWLTTITQVGQLPAALPPRASLEPVTGPIGELSVGASSIPDHAWVEVVAEATRRIRGGELEKVVLARDLVVEAAERVDVRRALAFLTAEYPTCWTFHVEGLFGATPELLVRREAGIVTSRVLAGTIPRSGDPVTDAARRVELEHSAKDIEEHRYAVTSVAEALAPFCDQLDVPQTPSVLQLPNVMHLATDVRGAARGGTTSVELAAALHPSAAVGGTPRREAVNLIAEIEGMDRGRYAAPVGWMDAAGDGEWGIALRSALITDSSADEMESGCPAQRVRLFAGCGVVGSSDPETELVESQAKMIPVRSALGIGVPTA